MQSQRVTTAHHSVTQPSSVLLKSVAIDFSKASVKQQCLTLVSGGGERDRTDDPLLAKQVLSQLSYTPVCNHWWVWLDSNQRPPPYQDGALTD